MAKQTPETYKNPTTPEDQIAEPAIVYSEINTLKEQVINCILQLNDTETLQRILKYTRRQKKQVPEETIDKEEVLAGIERGLKALKEAHEGKENRFRDINELMNEL